MAAWDLGYMRGCPECVGWRRASIVGDDSAAALPQVQGASHELLGWIWPNYTAAEWPGCNKSASVQSKLDYLAGRCADLQLLGLRHNSQFDFRRLRQIQQLRRLLLQNGLCGIARGWRLHAWHRRIRQDCRIYDWIDGVVRDGPGNFNLI